MCVECKMDVIAEHNLQSPLQYFLWANLSALRGGDLSSCVKKRGWHRTFKTMKVYMILTSPYLFWSLSPVAKQIRPSYFIGSTQTFPPNPSSQHFCEPWQSLSLPFTCLIVVWWPCNQGCKRATTWLWLYTKELMTKQCFTNVHGNFISGI